MTDHITGAFFDEDPMPSPLHPARLIAFKTCDKVVNPSSLKVT